MSILREFREFALKGNVIELAIGIIIGAAFTSIVNSLVDDIIMPPLGVIVGGFDFSEYFVTLRLDGPEVASVVQAREQGVPVIAYGLFINALIKFLIVAFALFIVVKQVNRLKTLMAEGQIPEQEVPPTKQEVILAEIRDLLAKRPV